MSTIRLLHFSDPHLERGLEDAGALAFANKRALGYANLVLRRRSHFDGADAKIRALAEFASRESIDFVLCTGDYTALGTREELAGARAAIEPFTKARLGFATVPGNHDVYVDDAPGAFESLFADGLKSDLDTHRWDRGEPYVRFVGEHGAIVGLASAKPNPVHRSSGRVPDEQLASLRRLLASDALGARFVFVALHYAPRLWNGKPDSALHGLENERELLDAVRSLAFGAVVFGHVHHNYFVRIDGVAAPLVGAGSATYAEREGAWLWELGEGRVVASRLAYQHDSWRALTVQGHVLTR